MRRFTRILRSARNQKETPIEALHLAEDIAALDLARKLIESVDTANIGNNETPSARDFSRDMKKSTVALIRTWQHHATLTMRKKYLNP
jgi:hypothetical protein